MNTNQVKRRDKTCDTLQAYKLTPGLVRFKVHRFKVHWIHFDQHSELPYLAYLSKSAGRFSPSLWRTGVKSSRYEAQIMPHKTCMGFVSKISSGSGAVTGVCSIPECTFSNIKNKLLKTNFNKLLNLEYLQVFHGRWSYLSPHFKHDAAQLGTTSHRSLRKQTVRRHGCDHHQLQLGFPISSMHQ